MRTAYILLAVILLAVAAAAGLMLIDSSPRGGAQAQPRHCVVFVDATRLLSYHPDAEALAAMRAVLSDIRSDTDRLAPVAHISARTSPGFALSLAARPATTPRSKLEAQVAKKAVGALGQLEAEQGDALQARLRATRQAMVRSAESEIAARTHEIRNEASDKLRQLAERYRGDRVNAQIKVAALGAARNGIRSVMDPMGAFGGKSQSLLVREAEIPSNSELAATESKLRAVQADLARVIDVTSAETEAVQADVRDRIAALRAQFDAEIETELAKQEEAGRKRIDESITIARADVMRELGMLRTAGGANPVAITHGGAARALVIPAERLGRAERPEVDVRHVNEAFLRLQASILADVRDVVRKLAEDKGLAVTFSRAEGAPDQTQVFAGILRSKGWEACGPVLCTKSDWVQ